MNLILIKKHVCKIMHSFSVSIMSQTHNTTAYSIDISMLVYVYKSTIINRSINPNVHCSPYICLIYSPKNKINCY